MSDHQLRPLMSVEATLFPRPVWARKGRQGDPEGIILSVSLCDLQILFAFRVIKLTLSLDIRVLGERGGQRFYSVIVNVDIV